MEGQWLKTNTGTHGTTIIVDIDEFENSYEGVLYTFTPSLPYGTMTLLRFPTKERKQTIDVNPAAIINGNPIPPDVFRDSFPTYRYPQPARLHVEERASSLKIHWIGQDGRDVVSLPRSNASKPTKLSPQRNVRNWDQFYSYCTNLPSNRYIFRGQRLKRRLRTSFHRTNRKDLNRFVGIDVREVHRAIVARTKHYFLLADGEQNGAFWNLMQHHGYPTPILDWTHSPFVAAFFAYREARQNADADESVRIFMFDRAAWHRRLKMITLASAVFPHFSIVQTLALENERAVPQQAISSLSNIDDIETYIMNREEEFGESYLRAFDLPYAHREKVLQQLRLMGITSGSMFPGLDGICEDLRDQHFGRLSWSTRAT